MPTHLVSVTFALQVARLTKNQEKNLVDRLATFCRRTRLFRTNNSAIIVSCLSCVVSVPQGVVARASWWDRTEQSGFSTDSHRVRSDLSQSASLAAAHGIDRSWAMIDSALGGLRPRTRGLQVALLFESQEDLSETMRSHFAVDAPSEVFAFRSPLGQGIALCTEDTPAPWATRGLLAGICGEYLRLACGADLPPAVQCGLLDLVARGDGALGGGGIGDAGVALVRSATTKKGAPSVQSILSMSAQQWATAASSDPTGALCEQSASIIRFLTRPNSPRGVSAFQHYLRLVATGTPSADAFAGAFGLDNDATWHDFDTQWRAFAANEKSHPLETVRERLGFFGEGLRLLEGEGAAPADFEALKIALTDRAFAAPKWWRPGFSQVRADCSSVFTLSDGCAGREEPATDSKGRAVPAKPATPIKPGARSARFTLGPPDAPTSAPTVFVADSQSLRLKLTWFKTRPDAEAPWVWDIGRGN